MSGKTRKERVTEIVLLLRRAKKNYDNGKPIMSDAEYDLLLGELRDISPNNPFLTKVGDAPKSGTGASNSSKTGYIRSRRMGSLNNAMNPEQLKKWIAEMREYTNDGGFKGFSVTKKIDGLSVELVYGDNRLMGAYTRGDGGTGEDVTKTILKMESNVIPKFIGVDGRWVIRGEAFITKSDFAEINKNLPEGAEEYTLPRSLAVGLLKSCNPYPISGNKDVGLRFLAWELTELPTSFINSRDYDYDYTTETGRLEVVNEVLKIPTVSSFTEEYKWFDRNLARYLNDKEEKRKKSWDIPTDGLVFSINTWELIDATRIANGTPLAKIAYKFPPERATSILKSVVWQVGKTGKVTPVAIFNPVKLSGSKVENASLSNPNEINRLKLRIGKLVTVVKAGEIIPEIIDCAVIDPKEEKDIITPHSCPECGNPLSTVGANIFCTNMVCPARVQTRILFFFQTLGILGFGPKSIETICNAKKEEKVIIKSIAEFIDVVKYEGLRGMGLGKKTRSKLEEAVATLCDTKIDMATIIGALGIPSCGAEYAKKVAEAYRNDPLLMCESLLTTNYAGLKTVLSSTINGDKIRSNIAKALLSHREEIGNICTKYLNVVGKTSPSNGKLSGCKFAVSGSLCMPRTLLEKQISERGGELLSSVTKECTHFIKGDGAKEHKADKARKNGAKIIDEAELMHMMGATVECA